MTHIAEAGLIVRKAETEAEIRAVFRVRYEVFVDEMGGDGPMVDHGQRLERDRFDACSSHLMLLDPSRGPDVAQQITGTFRAMDAGGAEAAGGFYTSGEYDLGPLLSSGLTLMECGRSCLLPGYRGGAGMHLLWQALARRVQDSGTDVLFGVASFPGRDPAPHREAISQLHHAHLAPPDLRPRALNPVFAETDLLPPERIDRLSAMRGMPALIKAYLRLGGMVGEGAFVDDAFNTTDVCMVLPVASVPSAQRARLLA